MSVLGALQKLGRALMLPIAVLPVAGLLLRLGSPDVLDIAFMKEAGAAIFGHLALIFAIGVAVGLSKDNAGAAALAGGVGYLVLTSSLKALAPDVDMGVLAGIISGVLAGLAYNRFHTIRLPEWLGFFGGRRFVPIVTAGAALVLSFIFAFVWPVVQAGINAVGQWIIHSGGIGAFAYGTLNRLLIPTGLHQVINSLVWFVFGEFEGAKGDLGRFFAGDPTAGTFMAGFYPVMMGGLPAACLAMYHMAPVEKRKGLMGMLLGVGLTSFITGVTEPVEFMFMFLAPALYVVHAVLTGLSLALCYILGIKAGFTFSAGAIDFVLSYKLATNGWMLLPLTALWFGLYYGCFVFFIRFFQIKTPGREGAEVQTVTVVPATSGTPTIPAAQFIHALGGAKNIVHVDACVTRLRLVLRDSSLLKDAELKNLGSKGTIRLDRTHAQVILGSQAEPVCDELRRILQSGFSIIAPIDGEILPLDQVPDPVFSDLLAGDGVAIKITGDRVVAPCDGIIEKIFKTNHAFAMRADSGAEILVHVGLDTVGLNGQGFTRVAHEGQRVKKGEPIFVLNLDVLTEKAKSLITPIVVANSDAFQILHKSQGPVVAGLDAIFTIAQPTQ
ncbi:N-acetylglucosamine-specific PTS transporter subunit IIBC [Oligoflexus tunisiensis]|uniref:N-acetylglucosamine-specific PTS transporter subunit IIBC n=1 Tax=Oligoflexus tunisiensis TaxID=708132 RepID=UPI00114CCF00